MRLGGQDVIHEGVLAVGRGTAFFAVVLSTVLPTVIRLLAKVSADQVLEVVHQHMLLHVVVQGVCEVTFQTGEVYDVTPELFHAIQDADCIVLDPFAGVEHPDVLPHYFGIRSKCTFWARNHQLLVHLILMVTMQVVPEGSEQFGGELA